MAKTTLPTLDAALHDRLVALANDIFGAGIEAGKAGALADILNAVGRVAPTQLPATSAPIKRGPGSPRKNPLAASTPASGAQAPKAEKATVLGPNDKACKVPTCGKKVVAKGLCQSHYRKATTSKYDLDALTSFQLEVLGQDGRATRWEKSKKK